MYVTVLDADNENPLLDSRFPDVSGKGRGYQLSSYPTGVENWPTLRKVSIWQTVGALEQEFRERTKKLAQSKRSSSATRQPEDTGDEPKEDKAEQEEMANDGESDGGGATREADDVDGGEDANDEDISVVSTVAEAKHSSSTAATTASVSDMKVTAGGTKVLGEVDIKSSVSGPVASVNNHSSLPTTSVANDAVAKGEDADRPLNPLLVTRVNRPRQLPKLAPMSLSKQVEELRKNQGSSGVSIVQYVMLWYKLDLIAEILLLLLFLLLLYYYYYFYLCDIRIKRLGI